MNKGFSYAHADENIPETVKFEISIKPIEKKYSLDNHDCDKNEDKHIGKKFKKDWEKDYSKEYDKDCGKDRGKDYDKDCVKDQEKDYKKICGKDREKDYEKNREKDCKKDWEKDCEQDCGIEYEKEDEYDKKKKSLSICADHYCISEEITVKSCDDLVCFDLGENFFKQNGFILELSLKLKDVCPKRRTALAVILYELDKCEKEYIRGFKTVLLPSAGKYVCSDICVDCLRFVVPGALDKNDSCDSCRPRKFVVRFIANYVDSDFSVCGCQHKA
ncbi:MAG: hypothetical protein ACYCWE_20125 [Eubacteriales bacterium]